jgi:hypothetical protein
MGKIEMYQICYVSRSTADNIQIHNDLREIISEARDFNCRNEIYGVLYYADGCFFQCLEGDEETVLTLINKLKNDKRHTDIVLFEPKNIDHAHFKDWSMKYVQRSSKIKLFFSELGASTFDITLLKQSHIDKLVSCLSECEHIETV